MKIEFDRKACAGWFVCVDHWDAFEMNAAEGKADLEGGTETDDDIFVRDVPEGAEEAAKAAAEGCPVEAIRVVEE